MTPSPVPIGREVTFTKTVSESDVYLFAGITGDFSPNHVNQQYMERSSWGRTMAHGALLVGFISTASTLAIADTRTDATRTPIAVGFDKVRFLKPVFLGDTVTTLYRIERFDENKRRTVATVEITNQHDELVAVAGHQLQWVDNG
ncbi:MAG: dehydratase [Gammaproteobacteria bacterium]|nr:dehydratase [Gammaproteobacteria bacterium]